jgi:hypothetical protein
LILERINNKIDFKKTRKMGKEIRTNNENKYSFWLEANNFGPVPLLLPESIPNTLPPGPPTVPDIGPGAIPTTLIPYSPHSIP